MKPVALSLEVVGAGKSFGQFRALDEVSMRVAAGSVHALLGENGAGKSTLVKGLIGYSALDQGQVLVDGRECVMHSPRDAHALGIGMVYQHFTLAPGLTVAENLLLTRGELPWRLDWRKERAALDAFMRTMPFRLAPERLVSSLAAGEKQKLEILKQLYLQRRFLILDEPTSVLTPQEAQEVLGMLRDFARDGQLTVLMITHKFHEVSDFADEVTVLRKGRLVGHSRVADTSAGELAAWMMGEARGVIAEAAPRKAADAHAAIGLQVTRLQVANDRGTQAVNSLSLDVKRGEIVGIAGISGNGQKELVEALLGQRPVAGGQIAVDGAPYAASRREMQQKKVFSLPEEPLRNACVAGMSVAENMALRDFDSAPMCRQGWRIDPRGHRGARARADRRLQRQAGLAAAAHRHPFRRQCAARDPGAGAGRIGQRADRRQSRVWPRFRCRRRHSRAHRGGARAGRRGAADQRRPRRTDRTGRPHPGHGKWRHRL